MKKSPLRAAMLLAVLATLLWSGNFIVARAVIHDISPVHLAFGRWLVASLIMLPIGFMALRRQWPQAWAGKWNILLAGLFGVCIFNTLVYIAGHHSEAIQLALLGTTSSPVFSFLLARLVLQEKIPWQRTAGLLVCIAGILMILSKGSPSALLSLRFSPGDWWILLAAFSFATYNIIVRRKPATLSSAAYLTAVFIAGTAMLLPFAVGNAIHSGLPHWSPGLVGMVIYLGAGTSVAAFLCWNVAIARLGAARASLFGMLIPVFSCLEAIWLLHEKMLWAQAAGMVVVFAGVFFANFQQKAPALPKT